MKTKTQNIRIVFWVTLGLAISFTSLALNRPAETFQKATVTPTLQAGSVDTASEVIDDVGSTDGIMLIAAVIVLIIIIPILLRRQVWSNGKPK